MAEFFKLGWITSRCIRVGMPIKRTSMYCGQTTGCLESGVGEWQVSSSAVSVPIVQSSHRITHSATCACPLVRERRSNLDVRQPQLQRTTGKLALDVARCQLFRVQQNQLCLVTSKFWWRSPIERWVCWLLRLYILCSPFAVRRMWKTNGAAVERYQRARSTMLHWPISISCSFRANWSNK